MWATVIVGLLLLFLNLYLIWRWRLGLPENARLLVRQAYLNMALGVLVTVVGVMGFWIPEIPTYLIPLGVFTLYQGMNQYEDS